MNWIQRKIYLYNVTFGLYMLDWWERYLFNTLVIVLMWFIFYNSSRYVTDFCRRYEGCIDSEIQQRAIEYRALSRKGASLMDILAEMPKFPERQSSLIKKAEDSEADTSEQGVTRENGILTVIDSQPPSTASPDLLGDLLAALAIEGPPATTHQSESSMASGLRSGIGGNALAIEHVEELANNVQVGVLRAFAYIFLDLSSGFAASGGGSAGGSLS